jgi:hypothetical protein
MVSQVEVCAEKTSRAILRRREAECRFDPVWYQNRCDPWTAQFHPPNPVPSLSSKYSDTNSTPHAPLRQAEKLQVINEEVHAYSVSVTVDAFFWGCAHICPACTHQHYPGCCIAVAWLGEWADMMHTAARDFIPRTRLTVNGRWISSNIYQISGSHERRLY